METNKKLRIAVLSRNFVCTGGGAERYAIALVEQLAEQHDVHVFAQTIQHNHPKVQYHLIGMPLRRPRWINQIYFATATWWATRQGFDIVHSHENTWHGNVQTVHVLPVKYNLFHNKHGMHRVLRWIKVATSPRLLAYLALEKMRFSLQKQRAIISVSKTLNEVMLQTYPEATSGLKVIPPGIDAIPGRASSANQSAAREKFKLPLTGHCILFVGNDFRKKGLPTLIQTMTKLPDDVFLAIAGHSSQKPEMDQIIKSEGLEKRVFYLGAVSSINEAYQAAEFLVHPTLEDTYAMVVLEAMAHGLPVVVSNEEYCGISAELENESNALFLSNPRDVDELTSACLKLLSNSKLVSKLSDGGLAFAMNSSWKQVKSVHGAVYSQLTSSSL